MGRLLKSKTFNKLSFQSRLDASTSHSTGTVVNGSLSEDHPDRKRTTVGSTLSYIKKLVKYEILLNYQKYFYKEGYSAPDGRKDKIVVELIILC